jgi:hypothetical protein
MLQRCCKKCSYKISKGEIKIKNFLIDNNIKFKEQFKFPNCRYKNRLPFDFAILNHKYEVECLIEYDGELHYMAIDIFGGEESLYNTKIRDTIKTNYCIENHIKLIRIPYWDFNNIETILTNNIILGGLNYVQ